MIDIDLPIRTWIRMRGELRRLGYVSLPQRIDEAFGHLPASPNAPRSLPCDETDVDLVHRWTIAQNGGARLTRADGNDEPIDPKAHATCPICSGPLTAKTALGVDRVLRKNWTAVAVYCAACDIAITPGGITSSAEWEKEVQRGGSHGQLVIKETGNQSR